MPGKLILVRHGQSTWNVENLFTGWHDVDLSDQGRIEAIATRYADGRQDRLDGLTVQFDDWWCNVRPSNTEPLLRLNAAVNRSSRNAVCAGLVLASSQAKALRSVPLSNFGFSISNSA